MSKERIADSEPRVTAVPVRNRIRVLILDLWSYVPYYDRYLCEALLSRNVDVRLAAASYYLDPGYFRKHGIRNRPGLIDFAAKLKLPDQLRRILMFMESCLNLIALSVWTVIAKPDVIHVQWIPLVRKVPFDLWFFRFVQRRGIKIVYTVHNVLPHDSGERFKDIYHRLYSSVDALICHNRQTKRRLESEFAINPSRIWVIPHGLLFHDSVAELKDFRARIGIGENTCLVLIQGMLKPYKGVGFLLGAWQRLELQGGQARLMVVGTGEPQIEQEIRDQVARLGIQDSVFLDFRYISDEELSSYYRCADILVYPYQSITGSGALMTGLCFRKPLILTRLPAFEEVFEGEKGPLFIDFGDEEALADSLKQLIEMPEQRARVAEECAQMLSGRYSWASIAMQTEDCYIQTLEQNQAI